MTIQERAEQYAKEQITGPEDRVWEESTIDYKTLLEEFKAAYLAGYNEAAKWISVKERLPDETGNYLVYGRYTSDCPMSVMEALYSKKDRKFTVDYIRTKNVTHWQPLPEKPKQ